ncbi:NAD(P)-binding protein [Thelephora ganbajun]|uniref:NAD(P)-binding protein n=1 Tax=Thelephora ganbajun TaxID=370292 RepID=A0ACB6Z695_THEGA|nr:NAD(P)-binding protein [Thelephora ganbajun]
MTSELVLVTGVNGFLGAHVVDQLVHKGYRVRGTVRGARLAANQEIYQKIYGSVVEIVAIDDIIKGDFTATLQGVDAVIHVASPLAGRGDAASTVDSAVLGSTNILRQAIHAGIKRFSIASSTAATMDFTKGVNWTRLTEDDYNPATREQALASNDPMYIYCASKALAEKAIGEIGAAHPDVSIAGINPTYFIGPFAPAAIIPPGDINALSTNIFIYNALLPDSKSTTFNIGFIDVRDVAEGLIAGINTPGKTRNLFTGEWFELRDAVEYIGTLHPELKTPTLALSGQTDSIVVYEPALKRLGLTRRPWKDSVREAAEAVLQIEKDWIAQGVDVEAEGGLRKNVWRV